MSVHHGCLAFTSLHVLFVRHWQPRPPHERQTKLVQVVRARSRRVQSGQAWESLDALYEGTFFGALPLAKRGALVFGLRGNIFRSEDGAAWEKIETSTNALLHGGVQLIDGRMILTAGAGELLLSENKGRSFNPVALPDKAAMPISLWQAGDESLLVTTDRGVIRLEPDDLAVEGKK